MTNEPLTYHVPTTRTELLSLYVVGIAAFAIVCQIDGVFEVIETGQILSVVICVFVSLVTVLSTPDLESVFQRNPSKVHRSFDSCRDVI